MEQGSEQTSRRVVVRPPDPLDEEAGAVLRERCRACFAENNDVIVDLSDVRFCDSSGLSALVSAFKYSRENKNRLVLCGLGGNLTSLLAVTRLHRIFETSRDPEEAVVLLDGELS